MTKSIVLLAAGILLCSAAPSPPDKQQPNKQRQLQESRDAAARQKLPSDFVNNPSRASLKDVPAHTISRLPKDTLKKLTPAQVRDNAKRFSQLGSQNWRNVIEGVSDEAFNETFDDWKNQARNLSQSQARSIVDRFAREKSSFTKADIQNLGGLTKGMSRDELEKISPDAISELQDARADFDHCQRRTVADVKKKQKSPSQFGPSDVDQLDAFVPDMDNGDMKKMSKATVKDSLDTLGKQSFRPDQARSLLMGADASSFTKDDVSKAGSLRPFIRSDQVKSMDAEAADEVAKQVKEPRKPMDQTLANHFFGRRAGKVNGTVNTKNLTCADMAEAAGQTAGLSTREQKDIPDREVASCVKRIGNNLGNNNPHQFRALGDKVFKGGKRNATFTTEDGRMKNVSEMKDMDFAGLGHMVKGMRSEHIDQANPQEFAKAVKMGVKDTAKGAQGSQKRAMLKKSHEGGLRKLSDLGSDLAKEIPLGMHQKMPDNATIHDAKDRAVELRDSQTSDLYERERKRLGNPAEGNETKWDGEAIKNLDRVVCGAPSEDVENMPADQGETMIGALSKCKGKHGAQRAAVRAHASNQQLNFSGIHPHDVEGFGKLAVNLDVDDIKKMPENSRSQFCCQIASNPDMKANVGADKVKFLLDLCSEEDEEEEQDGERRKRREESECDSSAKVEKLDDMNRGRSVKDIDKLCAEAHQNAGSLLDGKFNDTQRQALMRNRLQKVHNGDAGRMTGDDITDSGKSLRFLPDDQLSKIKPKSLTDALDSASQVEWSGKQAKRLIPILERGFGKNVSQWGGREHRLAGNITVGLRPRDIADMPSDAFDDALETIAGSCERLDEEQRQAIRNATKKKLGRGSFDGISEEDIGRMGCAGMHRDVVKSKNFGASEDGINLAAQAIKRALMAGNVDRDTETTAFETIKDRRTESRTQDDRLTKRDSHGSDVEHWTAEQIANTDHLMRGARLDDAKKFNLSALGGASHILGRINWTGVADDVIDEMSKKIRRGLSGDGTSDFSPMKWKCSHTSEMGSLIRREDVQQFNRSHIGCMDRDTIKLLGSNKDKSTGVLHAFSSDQLRMFDGDKAREIQMTPAYDSFTPEQRDSVDAAASVDSQTADVTEPTVTVAATPTAGAATVIASFGGVLLVAATIIY